MHRILVTIISAVASCALSVSAGNAGIMAHAGSDESGALDRLVSAMASSSVTFDYTYRFTPVSGPVLSGTGSVRFQGNSFIMKGNGLEIYCDGKCRWTIDRSAREAVAESFDAGHPDYLANPALISCSSARGTANFAQGPAMTMDQLFNALNAGCMVSERLVRGGYSLLACGEMGIGNTSAASAVSAALLDIDVETVTGPGAGLNADGLRRKIAAVKQGIKINCPDCDNIYDVLSKVGSFDIAAMTGFMIACAAQNVPVIIDGCISAAAALCAVRLCPAVRSYLIASHVSDEPAGKLLLKELELNAPITAGMRLGEGTGAVAFMPLLDMAFAVYTQAASFESSGVIPYTTFGAVSQ